jgi:hypothetical protein
VHAQFDEGLWLHAADFDAAVPEDPEGFDRQVALRFRPGATEEGVGALEELAFRYQGEGGAADVPPELANLRGVLPLPRLLAGFLLLLGLATLLHALLSTVRVRAGDFAVLRAIGFTRRSSRLVVSAQAAAVFLVGLAFGIPVGLAAGRTGWSLIAERIPLDDVAPLAVVATVLLVPAALFLAQLVAWEPGRRASRVRVAEVLRSE